MSMYGATFATVLGALTLMSLADAPRPRRTLLLLQLASLAGVCAQAVPGLPLAARFALLLSLGFFQSLGTGARLGLLAEVVPAAGYAPARSLMNITAGGTAILGHAGGAVLLRYAGPQGVFAVAACLTALGAAVVAATVREHSVRLTRRPGLRQTRRTNAELFAHPGRRALLIALWVPNGLIVGCEALFISYDPGHAGTFLAADPPACSSATWSSAGCSPPDGAAATPSPFGCCSPPPSCSSRSTRPLPSWRSRCSSPVPGSRPPCPSRSDSWN
ncbi:MFS transporter [Streptomyces erythrochromogenes]|uniref:hypothetical protein n=1 Tax=Streptomyces erythrochromogenes TaxID=285574 RepID=UPI003826E818